jgi:hypothetical protein
LSDVDKAVECQPGFRPWLTYSLAYIASGDPNNDRVVNVADVVCLMTHIFREGPRPLQGCAEINGCSGLNGASFLQSLQSRLNQLTVDNSVWFAQPPRGCEVTNHLGEWPVFILLILLLYLSLVDYLDSPEAR